MITLAEKKQEDKKIWWWKHEYAATIKERNLALATEKGEAGVNGEKKKPHAHAHFQDSLNGMPEKCSTDFPEKIYNPLLEQVSECFYFGTLLCIPFL